MKLTTMAHKLKNSIIIKINAGGLKVDQANFEADACSVIEFVDVAIIKEGFIDSICHERLDTRATSLLLSIL